MSMTSTDKLKERFYIKYIKNLIDDINNSNISYSFEEPESQESYYISKYNNKKKKVFKINDLTTELKIIWADNQELNNEGLIASIIKLSEQLYEFEKETDEVSPFIYQMF